MKVIFLNIDCILNTDRIDLSFYNTGASDHYPINNKKAENLKRIIDNTGAKFVLFCGHLFFNKNTFGEIATSEFIYLKDKLYGLQDIEIFSRTYCRTENDAEYDVMIWLRDFNEKEVENFVIIDYRPAKEFGKYQDHVLQTSFDKGLKSTQSNRAIRLLNYGKFGSNNKDRLEELVKKAYEYNSVGGALHIVLEDDNVEDEHILWCIENSIPEIKDAEERAVYQELAERLLQYPYSKRLNVL